MEEEKNPAPDNAENRPVISMSGSGLLNVAIWKNKTESGYDRYSVLLEKSYRESDGNYGKTPYLNASDLLRASELLRQADEWIEQDKQQQRTRTSSARSAGQGR